MQARFAYWHEGEDDAKVDEHNFSFDLVFKKLVKSMLPKLPKGLRGNKKMRLGGLFSSIRIVFVLAFLSSASANAVFAAESQGLYMFGEGGGGRDNMDITPSSDNGLEAKIVAYLAKYPIVEDTQEEDDDNEVGQDAEVVSFDGSRSLSTTNNAQDKVRDKARRSLAMEIKNHVVAYDRPLEYHIQELFMNDSTEESSDEADFVMNELFSGNDDLLDDVDDAFQTRERQLKDVAERHSSTIQDRFEFIGNIDGEPQYRFIPSRDILERDANVQNEVRTQFTALKVKMKKFKIIQKKVAETKMHSTRQLTTPRRSNDETFIMLYDGERRLSTPEDCNDEDDLCVSTTSLIVEATTSIDSVVAFVATISDIFEAFDDLDDLIGTLKTLSSGLYTAFKLCSKIPYGKLLLYNDFEP